MEIALAYVTCDSRSNLWDEWFTEFKKHWGVDLPCYFCGEQTEGPFFKSLPHEVVPVEKWTTKLKAQVEQMEEDYVFTWMDDMMQQFSIDTEWEALAEWSEENKPDALRIMGRKSRSDYVVIDELTTYKDGIIGGGPIFELTPTSHYRVSFSPNIWKREFLLEVLDEELSPWAVELRRKYYKERKICAFHIDGWFNNKIRV